MRIAILKSARLSRETQQRVGDLDQVMIRLLAQPGQQWESFDVENGEFPADPWIFNGFVITGSPASVYDDAPWIAQLLELTRGIHARNIPLLGICFGAQVVAQALGGLVEPNPEGWDLGIVEVRANGHPLPKIQVPSPLRILQSHRDIVVKLPPGAVNHATSQRTPHEIFTLGEKILCLQGHPEMDNEIVREIIEKRLAKGLLEPQRAHEGLASLTSQPHRDFLEDWLRDFFRAGGLGAVA